MATTPITASSTVNNTGAIDSTLRQISGGNDFGQSTFLKLLVTQLTNQNPLEPQDDKEFLAQLAQFSTVEGINSMKDSQTHQQGSDMLGKTVGASTIVNGTSTPILGKVTSVRWDGQGVHLTLDDKAKTEVMLNDVSQIFP